MAVSPAIRQFVRQRARGLCEYCHADERWQFVRFTLDHITPQSAGGDDAADNLALACRNCNERRGNRREFIHPDTGVLISIFDPRTQEWGRHFAWSKDKIRLIGITPVGLVTVDALDLNDDRRDGAILRIRQRDVDDGFHPPPGDSILTD